MARKEFTYDASHPAYVELQAEADALGLTIQQRIHLLIVGRYNIRHNLPYDAALWLPAASPAPAAAEAASSPTSGARELADEWL
jgi:hypothetical protein